MTKRRENDSKLHVHKSRLTENSPINEAQINSEHNEKSDKRIRRIQLNELKNEYEDVPHLNLIK